MQLERETIKNSHQYIESGRSALITYAREYSNVTSQYSKYEAINEDGKYTKILSDLKLQIEAILDQMNEEATKIPVNEIPIVARSLISKRSYD